MINLKNAALLACVLAAGVFTGCASQPKSKRALPPAPAMDSLADDPIVTAQPTIKRTDPGKAIGALTKGDDIKVKPPVPVLSATMPEDATE